MGGVRPAVRSMLPLLLPWMMAFAMSLPVAGEYAVPSLWSVLWTR